MLGVRAALGRLLTEADDRAGAPAALLLTHDYWQRAFQGDPSVVGRVFEMNDRPHTVVGVLAPFPQYSQAVDVYMPTSACPFRSNPATIAQRRARMGQAVGRAADGVSLESLQENLSRGRSVLRAGAGDHGHGIAGVVGYSVQRRRREFGVRLALGAPRTRVLGMVLGQGLSLVALGLFAGACASLPLLPLIRALPADSARFDPLALGLAAVVLLTVAAAACLVPAMRAARVDPLVVLRCE
jgi:hypothetical protein